MSRDYKPNDSRKMRELFQSQDNPTDDTGFVIGERAELVLVKEAIFMRIRVGPITVLAPVERKDAKKYKIDFERLDKTITWLKAATPFDEIKARGSALNALAPRGPELLAVQRK